jgi:hypothetical protein
MSNPRIYLDVFYAAGAPLPQAYWRALDLNQSQSLTEAGGTYTPSAPLVWGGQGAWIAGGQVLTFSNGAAVTTPASSGKRITHGDSDYFVLAPGHTGASRTLHMSLGLALDASGGTARMAYDNVTDGVQNFGAGGAGGRLIVPLSGSVSNGALLGSCTVSFKVGSAHAGVPASLPRFRLFKVDAAGSVTNLNLTTFSADAGGFVPFAPAPASGTAWYAAGAVQTFTWSPDGGFATVDTSKDVFFLEIVDEAGTNSLNGNYWLSLQTTIVTIPDLRPY